MQINQEQQSDGMTVGFTTIFLINLTATAVRK